MIMEYAANTRRLQEYVHALEEERRKVQVFQRELPLCMQLVTQAIESCKHLMETEEWSPGRTNCEATSSEGPVLEEFIPIKRSSSSEDEKNGEKSERSAKKPDWLRSVQLWSQENDSPAKEERRSLVEPKSGGAFQPFCREDKRTAVAAATPAVPAAAAEASSTADTGGIDGKEGSSTHRKARRCWSPELHRRFLNALQQLGGSHAATPKQIRELMKVDGLTNDEVKSHLQKYRLHTRRPGSTAQQNNNHQPPPQFVVVGGIWVPPPEYTAAAAAGQATGEATSGPPKEIYAPIASFPPSMKSQVGKQSQRPSTTQPLQYLAGGRGSRDEQSDNANSNSPSTSTSTSTSSHTTTNSP